MCMFINPWIYDTAHSMDHHQPYSLRTVFKERSSQWQCSRGVLEATLGQRIVWLHLAQSQKGFCLLSQRSQFQSPSVLACEVTGLISCSPQCSGRCGSNCSTSPVSLWEAGDTLQVVASKIYYGPDQIQAAPRDGILSLSRWKDRSHSGNAKPSISEAVQQLSQHIQRLKMSLKMSSNVTVFEASWRRQKCGRARHQTLISTFAALSCPIARWHTCAYVVLRNYHLFISFYILQLRSTEHLWSAVLQHPKHCLQG